MNPAPPVTSARIASFLVDGRAVAGASARIGLLDAVEVRAGRHDLVVADHGQAAEDGTGADAGPGADDRTGRSGRPDSTTAPGRTTASRRTAPAPTEAPAMITLRSMEASGWTSHASWMASSRESRRPSIRSTWAFDELRRGAGVDPVGVAGRLRRAPRPRPWPGRPPARRTPCGRRRCGR